MKVGVVFPHQETSDKGSGILPTFIPPFEASDVFFWCAVGWFEDVSVGVFRFVPQQCFACSRIVGV